MKQLRLAVLFSIMPLIGMAADPMIKTDFENGDKLAKALMGHKLLEVVDKEGVKGSKALKTSYVGYNRGSHRIVKGYRLPEKVLEATLVFDVKFDKGFQFVRGGKLHGLTPDKSITGGKAMQKDGWSARIMWRNKGSVHTYAYCQNKSSKYGVDGRSHGRFRFKPDKYHAVTIQVKVNKPASAANGSMMVYVDGRKVITHDKIQFRGVEGDGTLISHFVFSTFHGGATPDWAPKKGKDYATIFAYFDNIAVYKGTHLRKKPGDWK